MDNRTIEVKNHQISQINMHPTCHICGYQTNFLINKDGFDEYLCPNCGLSFVSPQPKAEWLKEKIYSAESGYQANKRTDLSQYKENIRITKILKFLKERKAGGNILDVGCSSGHFLYSARQGGFKGVGVELNERTAKIAIQNGFDVHIGFLETAPFEKRSFDVVYLGDVIEHVNDPRSFVATCREYLKEGGLLVIDTPNTECYWSQATYLLYKAFRIPWAVLTPPHHLFQFGFSNLNRLLLEQKLSFTHSFFIRPNSLRYELGSLHLFGKWKRNRNLLNLSYLVFSFILYTLVYWSTFIFSPLLKKNFHMIVFCEKHA
jgi:2-polyprenyl-3-methyl-5-hydroxy-6-metoxy-1,4-benzoquinol methylase/predicted RNA-binding Zn-ribbon protein involved in translation (DUF1610 family)